MIVGRGVVMKFLITMHPHSDYRPVGIVMVTGVGSAGTALTACGIMKHAADRATPAIRVAIFIGNN